MNTNTTSADAGNLQGGYGSPTPEDEMPEFPGTPGAPAGSSGHNEQTPRGKPEVLSEKVQDTDDPRSHQEQGNDPEKASNDPLLKPLTPAGKDPEQVPVSEADLNKARTPEPPD